MKKMIAVTISKLSECRLIEVRENEHSYTEIGGKKNNFTKIKSMTPNLGLQSYVARTLDAYFSEYLFELESDFSIMNYPDILNVDYPNKEYIKKRYFDLKKIYKEKGLL